MELSNKIAVFPSIILISIFAAMDQKTLTLPENLISPSFPLLGLFAFFLICVACLILFMIIDLFVTIS